MLYWLLLNFYITFSCLLQCQRSINLALALACNSTGHSGIIANENKMTNGGATIVASLVLMAFSDDTRFDCSLPPSLVLSFYHCCATIIADTMLILRI